jgi:hypothetical protein
MKEYKVYNYRILFASSENFIINIFLNTEEICNLKFCHNLSFIIYSRFSLGLTGKPEFDPRMGIKIRLHPNFQAHTRSRHMELIWRID